MRILFLSFYFEPDLSAGSFRNSCLFDQLKRKITPSDYIHVLTTFPNRYNTYTAEALEVEEKDTYKIERIRVPKHKSGFLDQINSFKTYYKQVLKKVKYNEYDIVYASSSRLFTAFLGSKIARNQKIPLYLDIRDIFVDTIKDVIGRRMIFKPLFFILNQFEKYTFSKAMHINLVSEGFCDYFNQYKGPTYSYFTNGIDKEFLEYSETQDSFVDNKVKVITYAGNIGSGQGLEKVIPDFAKKIGNDYLIQIIGDGGSKYLLINELKEKKVENVKIYAPVNRIQLIEFYKKSDFLFLHLNDLDAFKKVLPSKVFEYSVFNKPIIAGVAGYAAKFIQEKIPNSIIFPPVDVDSLVSQFFKYDYISIDRSGFIHEYSRENIMSRMSDSILALYIK